MLAPAGDVPAPPNPCFVPEGPPGTVTLPPDGCEYLSPDDVHMILAGLPPGTTVELAAIHKDFICHGPAGQQGACSVVMVPGQCEQPGGTLSGSVDCSPSVAELQISGTGGLASFSRTLFVPLDMEVHTAPRTPGAPVQGFDSSMVHLDGEIIGDPDFDLLRIRAGSDFGLPSPGHTTLTSVGGGTYQVDSFFDIDYRIEYQGAPGGALAGLGGTTTGTIRMVTGNPPAPNQGVPALEGGWILLFGGLLAMSARWFCGGSAGACKPGARSRRSGAAADEVLRKVTKRAAKTRRSSPPWLVRPSGSGSDGVSRRVRALRRDATPRADW